MKNILTVIIFLSACLVIPKLAVSDQVTHTIRCESEEFAPHNCELPVAPRGAEIKEIRKVRQLSSKPCIEGKSWMANESGITVRNGCRADFLVVYSISDRSGRRDHWQQRSDSRRQHESSDEEYPDVSQQYADDPREIVIRAFEDVLNRRPSREEMRTYRNFIIDRGWTERQVRHDIRNRSRSDGRN